MPFNRFKLALAIILIFNCSTLKIITFKQHFIFKHNYNKSVFEILKIDFCMAIMYVNRKRY